LGFALAVAVGGCCRSAPPAPAANSVNQPPAGVAAPSGSAEPPRTVEACRACNGDFGPHGIDPNPSCNCRTHDAGKRCRGKNDCEGECIGDLGDREVTSPGPPAMGHRLGRCAEFRTSYGCHVFLPPHGASSAAVALDQPPEQLCVD
jgi:hypothetical protein